MRTKISTQSMIGKRYGKLTVVGLAHKNEHSQWSVECVCDCGTRCVKMAKSLNYGGTRSCGCLLYASQRQEVAATGRQHRLQVGDRFGFLTVLKTGIPGIGGSGRLALCRCDCGAERYYSARYLRIGRHKSCGCVARGEGGLDSPRYAYQRAYIGCRVGSWTVIDILPRPLRTRQRLLCRCDCGTERAQYAHKLIGYKTLSCGCQGKRAPA